MKQEHEDKNEKEASDNDIPEPAIPRKNTDLKSILLIVLALVLVVLLGVGVAIYGFKSENRFAKAVASTFYYPMAVVGTSPVYLADYWTELNLVLRACEQVGTNCQITDDDKKAVTDRLVDEELWDMLAKQYDVTVDQNVLNEEYQSIVEQNGGEEEFLKVIVDDFGWTVEKFKEKMYLEMLRSELENAVIEKVKASHILISIAEDASAEDVEAARQRALEVVAKINEGQDFATVALEYSDDPSVAQNQGSLGFFGRNIMVPEFEEAAFSMEVGQISQPVRTSFGWHIIKVEEKGGEVGTTFDEWLDTKQQDIRVWIFI